MLFLILQPSQLYKFPSLNQPQVHRLLQPVYFCQTQVSHLSQLQQVGQHLPGRSLG